MIILEIFFALFVIAIILFGKIEFSTKAFKLSVTVAGRNIPLISVARKKETDGNDNVSI